MAKAEMIVNVVNVVHLLPDDVYVFRTDRPFSDDDRDALYRVLPAGRRVIVLPHETDLSIVNSVTGKVQECLPDR